MTSRFVPAPLDAVEAELERDVGAAVGAHRLAVEPHARAVVDRLEAHRPRERPARVGQREVLAVPADAADHRGGRVVAEVPDVRDLDRRTSRRGCVERFQPLPRPLLRGSRRNSHVAVHQVAAGRALVVEGLRRRLVGRRRDARQRQRERAAARGRSSLRAPRIRGITTQRPAGSRGAVTRTTPRARSAPRSPAARPRRRSAGPRAAAFTHCTTGSDSPARHATRPVPERRVIVTRTDGSVVEDLDLAGRAASCATRSRVTRAQAGSRAHAGSCSSTASASPRAWARSTSSTRARSAPSPGQRARQQERDAEEDEQAEDDGGDER